MAAKPYENSQIPCFDIFASFGQSLGMHLLYVDESGDTGRGNAENHTFILSGLLVHYADWHMAQAILDKMRRKLRDDFGLPMEAEIHASELLGKSPHHFKMDRMQRVKIALQVAGLHGLKRNSRLTNS